MIDISFGSIKSWAKVSLFMFGLWHLFWIIYLEVGQHLMAYNMVERLPYVYMELIEK
jgi:hypothetical protein